MHRREDIDSHLHFLVVGNIEVLQRLGRDLKKRCFHMEDLRLRRGAGEPQFCREEAASTARPCRTASRSKRHSSKMKRPCFFTESFETNKKHITHHISQTSQFKPSPVSSFHVLSFMSTLTPSHRDLHTHVLSFCLPVADRGHDFNL